MKHQKNLCVFYILELHNNKKKIHFYISSNLSVTINNFHERNQQFCFHISFLCTFHKYFFREIIIFYLFRFFFLFVFCIFISFHSLKKIQISSVFFMLYVDKLITKFIRERLWIQFHNFLFSHDTQIIRVRKVF